MKTAQLEKRIVKWLKGQVKKAKAKGLIVGLSGGIDSAVAAALAQKACGRNTLALLMPCESHSEDEKIARLVARNIGIATRKVVLDNVCRALKKALPGTRNRMVQANVKPRLRMMTLYYFASLNSYLVVGTGNKTEIALGYFTKYGDGGVDLLPLGDLVKAEVRALAEQLELPEEVIKKKPSAGLWTGQTDEGEIGLSYDILDKLVTGKKVRAAKAKKAKVKKMMAASEHKRKAIPIFKK
jgi:NAD+ synthase